MATELEVHAHRIGVLGATGATGRYIVQQCVACPAISRVYVYTRKEIPPADIEPLFKLGAMRWDGSAVLYEDAHLAKIVVRCIDYEKLHQSDFEQLDVLVSALGTTAKDAGDEGRYKVDYTYNYCAAELAFAAGTRLYSLVSSTGADASSTFAYMKLKGELENAVKTIGFSTVSLWRPGLLEREEKSRCIEKCGKCLCMSTMNCRTLAAAIVVDLMQHFLQQERCEGAEGTLPSSTVFENSDIYTKSGDEPPTCRCCCCVMS